jgi:hypothetical protein
MTKLGRSPRKSQTRAVPSSDAVTTCVPFASNRAELTGLFPSRATKLGRFPRKSHTRADSSYDAVTTCVPSALNHEEVT